MATIERMEMRVLVLAARGRDAEVIASVLKRDGIDAESVDGSGKLMVEVERGAAAAIVCEESLTPLALADISH